MNRPIKFKLWDKGYDKFAPQNVFTVIGDERQVALCIKDWETAQEGEIWYDFQCELLQYTGLKDKNGQEIYEGDIIGVTHYFIDEGGEWQWESKHEVVWGGGDYPAFELKPSLKCECNGLSYLKCNPEVEMYAVIGNIYENPYLLEND